jgi:hypothetical protein
VNLGIFENNTASAMAIPTRTYRPRVSQACPCRRRCGRQACRSVVMSRRLTSKSVQRTSIVLSAYAWSTRHFGTGVANRFQPAGKAEVAWLMRYIHGYLSFFWNIFYIYGQQTTSLKTFKPPSYPGRKIVRLESATPQHKTVTSFTSLLSMKLGVHRSKYKNYHN